MANGHGGPRTPAHPAPVSGPGALSQRTDGGPAEMLKSPSQMLAPGGPYGSRQDMQQIQSGAEMTPPGGQSPQGSQIDPSQLTPIDAPTSRPDEPVQAGVQQILSQGQPQQPSLDPQSSQLLRGALPTLLMASGSPRASEDFRNFARAVQAMVAGSGG